MLMEVFSILTMLAKVDAVWGRYSFNKGVILRELSFFTGRGHLFVIAGRQFFLVPPFECAKRFWSPSCHEQKASAPFAYAKIFWSPYERTPPYINNETLRPPSWEKILVSPSVAYKKFWPPLDPLKKTGPLRKRLTFLHRNRVRRTETEFIKSCRSNLIPVGKSEPPWLP